MAYSIQTFIDVRHNHLQIVSVRNCTFGRDADAILFVHGDLARTIRRCVVYYTTLFSHYLPYSTLCHALAAIAVGSYWSFIYRRT